MSSRSTTTSTTQSQSFIFEKSSSKLPVSMREAKFLSYNGAGFDLMAVANAPSATLLRAALSFFLFSGKSRGTMSSMRTCRPTLAKWQAIPDPITPEPRTATFLILLILGNGCALKVIRCSLRTARRREFSR